MKGLIPYIVIFLLTAVSLTQSYIIHNMLAEAKVKRAQVLVGNSVMCERDKTSSPRLVCYTTINQHKTVSYWSLSSPMVNER